MFFYKIASIKDSSCVLTLCDHRSIFCPPETLQYTNIEDEVDQPIESGDKVKKNEDNIDMAATPSSPSRSNQSSDSSSEEELDDEDDGSQHEFKTTSLYDKNFTMPTIPTMDEFVQMNSITNGNIKLI